MYIVAVAVWLEEYELRRCQGRQRDTLSMRETHRRVRNTQMVRTLVCGLHLCCSVCVCVCVCQDVLLPVRGLDERSYIEGDRE
jgi:hypothetical protein